MAGGYLSGRKAAQVQDRRFDVARGLQWQNINDTRRGFAGAEGLLRQGLGATQAGFGQAFGHLSRAGVSGRQSVLDQQRQGLGAISAGLASRGLGSTTVLQNAQRGMYSDTSRRLAEIDENIGSMLANLAVGRGSAMSAGLGGLAGMRVAGTQALTGQRNDMQSILLGTVPTADSTGGGLASLGTLLALYGGKGATSGTTGGASPLSFFQGKAQSAYQPNPYQTLPFQLPR